MINLPNTKPILRRYVYLPFEVCLRQRIILHVINRWEGLRKLIPTDPFRILYDLIDRKYRNSRRRIPYRNFNLRTHISACMQHTRNFIRHINVFGFDLFNKTTRDIDPINRKYRPKKSKTAASNTGILSVLVMAFRHVTAL